MNAEDINNFSMAIEEMVYMNDIPYIDAICLYCEENGFEVAMAAKLFSEIGRSHV